MMNYFNSTKLAIRRPLMALFMIAGLGLSTVAISPVHATDTSSSSSVTTKDPLAGDTWHAAASSWPGTIKFDGRRQKVALEPVGAEPIHAGYELSQVKTEGDRTTGKLKMTSSAGQVSVSTFTISGKSLQLSFGNGQPPESYVRMTSKEAEAEQARLLKAIKEGRTKIIGNDVKK